MRWLLLIAALVVAACGQEDVIAVHTRAGEAPAWAVPYGHEFWRPSHGVDVHDAIARVSHAFHGTAAHAAGYSARIDGAGLSMSPAASTSSLRLRTTRVTIDGRELPRAEESWSIVGDTAQGRLAPGVIEHYQVRDEGVEVAWVIAQRGALVIEATFDGLVPDQDLHFVDHGTRVAKLSPATLVDHAGHRWPVAAELDGTVVRYRIAADVVASAEYPVALDPVIGPELVPDAPVIGSAPSVQETPSVASNGTVSLAVWGDMRGLSYGLWAARISPDGVVLDPGGIALVETGYPQQPRIASNGADFLITWLSSDDDVYAARVGASGTLLDPGGVWLAHAGDDADPALASGGTDYLVAWRTGRRFAATRVSAAGVVLDAGGFLLSTRLTASGNLAIASNGTGYLAAWSEDRHAPTGSDIYATRITPAGTVLDPQGTAISVQPDDQVSVTVASNSSDYLIAWHDSGGVRAARVSAAGALLDANGITLGAGTNASAASDGTGYLVSWQNTTSVIDHSILARRLTAAGTILDAAPITLVEGRPDVRTPAVAFDGTQYLVAWAIYGEPWDIDASRVCVDGTVESPFVVSTGPVQQISAAVAASATEILVAWIDERDANNALYAARLSPTGVPLDPAGLLLGSTVVSAAAASNGSDFVVTWRNQAASHAAYAASITSAGVVGVPVMLGTSTSSVAVASDGSGYLVALSDANTIDGVRVTGSGATDGTPFSIATLAASIPAAELAWGGGQYLVVWSDGVQVDATRVSATGQVLDAPFAVSTAAGFEYPVVAASGSEYLVCWHGGPGLPVVYGARVSFAGAVLDSAALPISATSGDHDNMDCNVASNGSEYLVAWNVYLDEDSYDVLGARVSASGTVVDPGGVTLAGGPGGQLTPYAAYSPASDAYLVTYRNEDYVHARFIAVTGCGDGVLGLAETCDDGGTVDGDGCSASCATEPGYTCSGAPSTCTDIDECATDNGGCAQTCTNTVGGHVCSCATGYALDANGHTCDTTDVNECATNNGGCAQACTNMPGSFVCSCGSGYTLASDGLGCDDIDECATNNGGCPFTCVNSVGSFLCQCAPGFGGDGHTCEDIDECATNNGDCTQICTNTVGSRDCSCQVGYALDADGVQCLDVNECAAGTSACSRYALCANTTGAYTCSCDEGYTGDGFTCKAMTSGGGCSTTDARGSWLFVLACLGLLRRRPAQGRAARKGGATAGAAPGRPGVRSRGM